MRDDSLRRTNCNQFCTLQRGEMGLWKLYGLSSALTHDSAQDATETKSEERERERDTDLRTLLHQTVPLDQGSRCSSKRTDVKDSSIAN